MRYVAEQPVRCANHSGETIKETDAFIYLDSVITKLHTGREPANLDSKSVHQRAQPMLVVYVVYTVAIAPIVRGRTAEGLDGTGQAVHAAMEIPRYATTGSTNEDRNAHKVIDYNPTTIAV